MAYLVIAYPNLETTDFDWIQEYRQKNDSRYYLVVNPHITLVFAVHDIAQDAFINEVVKQLETVKAFNVTFKVATINQDDSGEYFHEFLVPDDGYSSIVKLHDKLYSELFAGHLRYDIDFIPHIGIGNSEDVTESKNRVDDLNSRDLLINATVSSVDIVKYKDGIITTLQKIQLH